MAVKKTTKKKEESAAPTKAEAKETAPKKKAPKKAAAPVADAATTTPAPTPAAKPAKSASPASPAKAGAKKAATPVKLTTSQHELLKKIGETSETGYTVAKKIEERSIEGLMNKKLIKKGAKDKATGSLRYHISTAGKKHLG